MSEVSPDQSGRRRAGIVQKMVMVHPDDGDEEIADRVADDRRPEFNRASRLGACGGRRSRARIVITTAKTASERAFRRSVFGESAVIIPVSCRCRPARQCLDAPIWPEQQAGMPTATGRNAVAPTFVDIRSNRRIGYTCFEKNRGNAQRRVWRGLVNRGSPQPNLATFASPVTCCGVLTRSFSHPSIRKRRGDASRRLEMIFTTRHLGMRLDNETHELDLVAKAFQIISRESAIRDWPRLS